MTKANASNLQVPRLKGRGCLKGNMVSALRCLHGAGYG